MASIKAKIIERACDIKLHSSILLTPTPDCTAITSPLRVSYSLVGPADAQHTLLFLTGMFGGRLLNLLLEPLASAHRTRVLIFDRPGNGGSTPVPLDQRLPVFLEAVPLLLGALGIRHVALASHSAGTVYALNFLLRLRRYLDPRRPYVAMLSPYVHPTHSGVVSLRLATWLPTAVVGRFDVLVKFIINTVDPGSVFSSGSLSAALATSSAVITSGATVQRRVAEEDEQDRKREAEEAAETLVLLKKYMFSEELGGGSEEALLCLKSRPGLWGSYEEYDEAVTSLGEQERLMHSAEEGASRARLKVKVFFPETDALMGTRGMRYFEDCWVPERRGPCVDFETETVPGSDHESICKVEKGAWEKIFTTLNDE